MKTTDFAHCVFSYLTMYLPGQAGLSENTIMAYRDTFKLLLQYAENVKGIKPERFSLLNFNAQFVKDFLDWLEQERGCCVATRNQRLAAIRAFARYARTQYPEYLAEIDYKNASTLVATVQTKLDDGYTFTAVPHNYTTFKMADGEGNEFAAPANCADLGDAYWKCATCSAETFRENSLSMKDYLDPAKNVDYSTLTPAQKEVVHAGTELACGEHCDDANCVYADSKEADCATAAYVVKYGSTTETLVVYHNAADDNAKVQKVSDGYAMSATKANAVWTALGDLTGKVVKANGVEVADATALAAIVFNGSNTIEIVVEVAP